MKEVYGVSQLNVPRFSAIDMQHVLNENRKLRMELSMKKKREVIFWANQHGQGVVLLGKLAQRLLLLAKSINKTPEELLKQALGVKALEALYENKNKHIGHWPSDTLTRMRRRNKTTRTPNSSSD